MAAASLRVCTLLRCSQSLIATRIFITIPTFVSNKMDSTDPVESANNEQTPSLESNQTPSVDINQTPYTLALQSKVPKLSDTLMKNVLEQDDLKMELEAESRDERKVELSVELGEEKEVELLDKKEAESRDEQENFASEKFKIEIRNIPPFVGFQQLRKRLQSLGLKPVKIKLLPRQQYCFVTFRNEEERQTALSIITGHVWKKRTLKASYAKPAADPMTRKRKVSSSSDDIDTKRICQDISITDLNERLAEAVTPLLHTPYSEQLETKVTSIKTYLRKVVQQIKKTNPGEWFYRHIESNEGLLCPIDTIIPAPVLEEYRNKCEFTIGYGTANEPVIGFRLGSYCDGDLTVVPPYSCIQVQERMKQIVKVLDNHIKHSPYRPFDTHLFKGHWRQVAIRSHTTGQCMIIIAFHSQQLSQEEVSQEKQKIIELFTTGDGTKCSPLTVYWQTFKTRNEKPEFELLVGEPYIYEEVSGLKFRVSPDAFFQVNTKAAEKLFDVITELCSSPNNPPIIYDICCGTGTIGIAIAKKGLATKVIGVELSQQAVNDAKVNAELNGVKNTEFITGRAEEVLPTIMLERQNDQVCIGIADPPRGGLHHKVIQAIRRTKNMSKFIYISCNPEGTQNNFIDLCRPRSNRVKGLPFRPVRAIPVDMFPHTPHCELVVLFERIYQHEVLEQTLKDDFEPETTTSLFKDKVNSHC